MLGLHDDKYDLVKEKQFQEYEESKLKRLDGDFKRSYYYDNGVKVDEFGIKIKEKPKQKKKDNNEYQSANSTRSQSYGSQVHQARLRNTGNTFENTVNGYGTFLNEKSELPRLSILDNYKQIMRIMTNSFIKGSEYQNKFKNRMEKDIINDEEYVKFKEEENNTKKMSTILKSLNHPIFQSTKLGKTQRIGRFGGS